VFHLKQRYVLRVISKAVVLKIYYMETRGTGHKPRLTVAYTEPQTTRTKIIIAIDKKIYEIKINIH
jgi:hypothetical protein